MAKYYGAIGYAKDVQTAPGVWSQEIEEHFYRGDVLRNNRRWENGQQLNDNLNINNYISIVGDQYAYDHVFAMRYVHWMGTRWKITNVEVQRPRLLLTIGGVYNGPTVRAPEDTGDNNRV